MSKGKRTPVAACDIVGDFCDFIFIVITNISIKVDVQSHAHKPTLRLISMIRWSFSSCHLPEREIYTNLQIKVDRRVMNSYKLLHRLAAVLIKKSCVTTQFDIFWMYICTYLC